MTEPASETTSSPPPAAEPDRRSFLDRFGLWISGGIGAVAGAALALPLVGYLLGPVRRQTGPWVDLGPLSQFPQGQTRLATFVNPLGEEWAGMTANTGVWVRSLGKDDQGNDQFMVFAINCAHLGCPVEWFPQSGLFMCPCHGGVYYETGERASGPPPRGLFQCVWQVREGKLEIQAPHYPTLHNTLKDRG